MLIDPVLLATLTGFVGAIGAMCWSYLMASKVAAPRAKRLIVEALTNEGPELDAVRKHLIDPAVKEATASVEPPDIDMEELAAALGAQIGPEVSNHMQMAFARVEAQQSKRVGAFLKDLGIDDQMEALEGAAKEEALAAMGPQAQVLMEILQTKIPKNATLSERLLMQSAKVFAAQMAQGQGFGMRTEAAPVHESSSRGFGVR